MIVELKDSLKTLVNDSKQIRIKVLQIAKSENESNIYLHETYKSLSDELQDLKLELIKLLKDLKAKGKFKNFSKRF